MPTILGDIVTLGAASFNDPGAVPVGSVIWKMDLLDGWDDDPEIRAITTERGGNLDGEFAASRFPTRGRRLLVGGYVMGTDRAATEELKTYIKRDAFPLNEVVRLTRFESIPKYLDVRVSAAREIQSIGPQLFRYTIPMLAPDPLKYGTTLLTAPLTEVAGTISGGFTLPFTLPLILTAIGSGVSASATLVNLGDAESFPTITVYGPLTRGAWRLVNETTDESIRFDVGLATGDVMVIDFYNQTALLNGVAVTSTIAGDFWAIQPGPNEIRLYATYDPAAGFIPEARSAWR